MRHVATWTHAPDTPRRVRLAVQAVALVLVTAAIVATVLPGTASAGTHAGSEGAFVTKMNAERRAAGLGRLTIDTQLTRVARTWTQTMAAAGTLQHNPRLATQVRGDWRRVGENVGYSSSAASPEATLVARLHAAFMASPGHRANIFRQYNQVGVGVTVARDGTMWVTVVFAQASLAAARVQVGQALATSRRTFATAGVGGNGAGHVTLAAAPVSGTATPAVPSGPTLFTPAPSHIDPDPVLHPSVRAEIDRVLGGSGTVYVVGGESLVSARAARELIRDGYRVQRLVTS